MHTHVSPCLLHTYTCVCIHIGICYKNLTLLNWWSWLISLEGYCLSIWSRSLPCTGRQSGRKDECKMGARNHLERKCVNQNQWGEAETSIRSQFFAEQTYTPSSEKEELKKDPREGGAITGPASTSPQLSEPADRKQVPVVRNGCRFVSILQVSRKNIFCGPM